MSIAMSIHSNHSLIHSSSSKAIYCILFFFLFISSTIPSFSFTSSSYSSISFSLYQSFTSIHLSIHWISHHTLGKLFFSLLSNQLYLPFSHNSLDTPFSDDSYFNSYYPQGNIIGEGGYKVVLKCQKNTGEEEAVSIMDLQDLKKKGKSFTIIIHNRFINCS